MLYRVPASSSAALGVLESGAKDDGRAAPGRIDRVYVAERRRAGYPDCAIAKMGGWCLEDVSAVPRLTLVAGERAPALPDPALVAQNIADVWAILEHLAEQYGITPEDILGPSHLPEHVAPRHEAISVVWELGRYSTREMAQIFRKDVMTIPYALKRHYERLRMERDWS